MTRKRKAETQKPKEVIKVEELSSEEEEVEEEVDEEVEEGEGEKEEEEEDEEEEEEEEEESSSSDESSEEEEESSEEDEDDLENVDEATKRQKLRKLLESFGKDQIISILKDAASTDPDILSRITQKVDSDPIHRKIFVYGMGWDATNEQFKQAFQPFGEMEECTLKKDKSTGRAKGYGFVLYKTRSAAKKALKNPQKKIGNRMASCQLAALGTVNANANANANTNTNTNTNTSDARSRKIFVGNVTGHISSEKLRSFFETFGELEEGPSGFDPVTNRPRGYAFFVYKTEDGLKNALEEPVKHFEGCQLTCRKFVNDLSFNSKNTTVNAVVGSDQKQGNVGSVMPVNPVNPGVYGAPNMSSGGGLVQQTPPSLGFVGNPPVASSFHQPSFNQPNFNQSNFNQPGFGASGVMGAMAGNYGINSISPSVIGSYGFGIQAALQGLGAVRPPAATALGPAATRGPSVSVPTGMSYPPRPGY